MALFQDNEIKESKPKKAVAKKGKIELVQYPIAYKVLTKPRITEKAHMSLGLNKYIFQVASDATKVLIKKAIEEVYAVHVVAVNTITIPAKKRNFGRSGGFKSAFKKAIVTLKEGESIELFQMAKEE